MSNHENRKRGYLHYILEVPHLGEPFAWVATNEADYFSRAMKSWRDGQDGEYWTETHEHPGIDQDLDDARELTLSAKDRRELVEHISGEDLSGYYVARGRHELRELLAYLRGTNAPRIGKCGPVRAANALEDVARRWR